jgi:hypothetical protein
MLIAGRFISQSANRQVIPIDNYWRKANNKKREVLPYSGVLFDNGWNLPYFNVIFLWRLFMKRAKIDRSLFERHGFLTFLFVFGIVYGVVSILALIMLFFDEKIITEDMFIYVFYGLLMFIPYILLLKWRMLGFILNCIFSVLLAIFAIMMAIQEQATSVFDIVSIIVSPVILFFLLQLKKNDVPAWAYLRGKTPESFRPKKDASIQDALICKSCQKTFSSGYTSCPHCSSKDIETNPNATVENSEIQDIPFVNRHLQLNSKNVKNVAKK